MKAHGVPALLRHLRGEITLEQAAEIGRADTRHYAKRQFTWFRHQLPEFDWVKPEEARGWLAVRSPDERAISGRASCDIWAAIRPHRSELIRATVCALPNCTSPSRTPEPRLHCSDTRNWRLFP